MNLINNKGCNFHGILESHVDAVHNSNSIVSAKGSQLTLTNNINLVVNANGGELKLINNNGANVDLTEGGFITAFWNRNLCVKGGGGRLFVRDTANHNLTNVESSQERVNRLEIVPAHLAPSKISSFLDRMNISLKCQTAKKNREERNNISFNVDFIGNATIITNLYKLGSFQFLLEKPTQCRFELTVDLKSMEMEDVEVQKISSKELILKGTKNGNEESLKICGPKVEQLENAQWTFLIQLRM